MLELHDNARSTQRRGARRFYEAVDLFVGRRSRLGLLDLYIFAPSAALQERFAAAARKYPPLSIPGNVQLGIVDVRRGLASYSGTTDEKNRKDTDAESVLANQTQEAASESFARGDYRTALALSDRIFENMEAHSCWDAHAVLANNGLY